MRYPIGILGISIFILYQLRITMKIKIFKLREVFKKHNINEGIISKLLSLITGKKAKKQQIIQKYKNAIDTVNSDIENLINAEDNPQMKELMRNYIQAFKRENDIKF